MPTLKLGSTGPRVATLQRQLQLRGFDPGEINGQFSAATDAAVRAFQASVGLATDGKAGPNTLLLWRHRESRPTVTADLVAPLFPGAPRLQYPDSVAHLA
jgi:peptidoglycan hydrolase-like protein with peptidoglycan-binding domain